MSSFELIIGLIVHLFIHVFFSISNFNYVYYETFKYLGHN